MPEIEFADTELDKLNEVIKFFENNAKWAMPDDDLNNAFDKIRRAAHAD